jgi:hypothetical protein
VSEWVMGRRGKVDELYRHPTQRRRGQICVPYIGIFVYYPDPVAVAVAAIN